MDTVKVNVSNDINKAKIFGKYPEQFNYELKFPISQMKNGEEVGNCKNVVVFAPVFAVKQYSNIIYSLYDKALRLCSELPSVQKAMEERSDNIPQEENIELSHEEKITMVKHQLGLLNGDDRTVLDNAIKEVLTKGNVATLDDEKIGKQFFSFNFIDIENLIVEYVVNFILPLKDF